MKPVAFGATRQMITMPRLFKRESSFNTGDRMMRPPSTRWVPADTNRFACFLSHFKAESGSDARYLRDLLQRMLGCPVFLDSSDLTDLRALFTDGVHRSDVLVLLATEKLLTRPWCILELWEAVSNDIPVVVMAVRGRGWNVADAPLDGARGPPPAFASAAACAASQPRTVLSRSRGTAWNVSLNKSNSPRRIWPSKPGHVLSKLGSARADFQNSSNFDASNNASASASRLQSGLRSMSASGTMYNKL